MLVIGLEASCKIWTEHVQIILGKDVGESVWDLGFGFRVVSLHPNFRKLSTDDIVSAYIRTKKRAILSDYDGTVMPQVDY
ncbi:putative alpha,alpha-trehalose-phosphate synthase [Artemisia annua]|uniref:Putative alpha,alpha-trehalose-phosphate synthase n=1 Tax=Artemisia annua TaxID=35608 RepID=A0A2U1QGM7_ARTAN|nr:putative alpha,alpha-trehalose-phosphate synthase [Artemisia annua]